MGFGDFFKGTLRDYHRDPFPNSPTKNQRVVLEILPAKMKGPHVDEKASSKHNKRYNIPRRSRHAAVSGTSMAKEEEEEEEERTEGEAVANTTIML